MHCFIFEDRVYIKRLTFLWIYAEMVNIEHIEYKRRTWIYEGKKE
jgi:hypothetical protein